MKRDRRAPPGRHLPMDTAPQTPTPRFGPGTPFECQMAVQPLSGYTALVSATRGGP